MSRVRISVVTGFVCVFQVASLGIAHAQDADESARHLTLDEAQRTAVQATPAIARLGQLSVEAAEHHRRAVAADYFPKFGAMAWNIHFNQFLGQEFTVARPLVGGTGTITLPLLGQDQSLVAITALQPLTPIFKVRQAVNLARADENIARAKAGMPVAESQHALTKTYFDLLIAQKQLALAEARVRSARAPALVNARLASGADGSTALSDELMDLSARVRVLTASLNERLGWPADTRLELETPAPLVERISFGEAVDQALATNPAVIEAEQNVEKAKAGTMLSKLDYVPDIAVVGGFYAQSNVIPALPNNAFYVGVFGSYNIFDSGKREQTFMERSKQLEMARTALELTRAKVSAAVKTSYLELERSRELTDLAVDTGTETRGRIRRIRDNAADIGTADAQLALEQIQLDWRHRQAYAELQAAIGKQ